MWNYEDVARFLNLRGKTKRHNRRMVTEAVRQGRIPKACYWRFGREYLFYPDMMQRLRGARA